MQDAQSLYERAASRSLNQSMTLLADEIQQVPTRMPPINDQEQQKDASIPNSTTINASSSDSAKLKNQVRKETDAKNKNPRSTKSSGKLSVATSPMKANTASDPNKLLSMVSRKWYHSLAIGINPRSTI